MRVGNPGRRRRGAAPVADQVRAALDAAFPGVKYLQVDSVGGKVSDELVVTGFIAVVLVARSRSCSTSGCASSGSSRSARWSSLFHDVIVVVGVFSLLQIQFDLTIVAALLTIIGYSINDTVVVFDRVRENLRKYKKMPLRDVLNLALNETLSRTMMTIFTVLIALLALLVFGGPVTFGFALAMMFGADRRHLLVDLGGDRDRAPARRQARLGLEARRQGRHPVGGAKV